MLLILGLLSPFLNFISAPRRALKILRRRTAFFAVRRPRQTGQAKESLQPENEPEKAGLTAVRLIAKEISAQTLEQVAGITGSVALLAGQQKEGCLARLTRELLQTADDLKGVCLFSNSHEYDRKEILRAFFNLV